jgi:hypothetical protein
MGPTHVPLNADYFRLCYLNRSRKQGLKTRPTDRCSRPGYRAHSCDRQARLGVLLAGGALEDVAAGAGAILTSIAAAVAEESARDRPAASAQLAPTPTRGKNRRKPSRRWRRHLADPRNRVAVLRAFPDVAVARCRDRGRMESEAYPVVFRERNEAPVPGSLALLEGGVLLSGGSRERSAELSIAFSEMRDLHIGHKPEERLNGSATLVIERDQQPPVLVAPIGVGLLHEIADLLGRLANRDSGSPDQLAIMVPLRPGCSERARDLLTLGPPLDPASLGLTGHRVYLEDDNAVFVFTGPGVRRRVQSAMRTPALWKAGIAWRNCIAGQPQVIDLRRQPITAEPLYTWKSD